MSMRADAPRPPAAETVSMRTRDGTRLDADVWRPSGPGRHPVLLMRQPYGRRIASTVVYAHPAWYAAQGYIVVIQDVRGTGSSEGGFSPYAAEAEDGADAVDWAAGLPGSSGEVGMYGFSYQGATQLLALSQAPAALRAVTPNMSIWDLHPEKIEEGGAFPLAGSAFWAAQMGAIAARRAGDAAAYAELAQAGQGLRFDGPVPAAPEVLRRHAAHTHYALWREAPADHPYFTQASPARRIGAARPAVPGLWVGGWFDYHLTGTVAGFRALSEGPAPQHLLIGPWTHLGWSPRGAGAEFGPAATSDVDAMQVAFFDHVLKRHDPPRWMLDGRVRLFDLRRQGWAVFDAWPEGEALTLHPGGDGRATTRAEDGTLSPDPGGDGMWQRIVHDPWRPVPSFGLHHGAGQGWRDRSEIDARFDTACFTTTPVEAAITLAGTPELVLTVEADAPCFDVNATLSLVLPDGRAFALSQGHALRRAGGEAAIAMRPFCTTLLPGDRLRLTVAGACFPACPVNPGTGTDPRFATGAEAVPVTLAIQCGMASRLMLRKAAARPGG
jgi:putative CocE/NonD family hydrolase